MLEDYFTKSEECPRDLRRKPLIKIGDINGQLSDDNLI